VNWHDFRWYEGILPTVDHFDARMQQVEPYQQPPQVSRPLVAARPGQHLHHYRLGDRNRTASRDQGGEPLADRASGSPVVLEPGGRVGQDHAAPWGGASAGGWAIAWAPRIASASLWVIGCPARCRSAKSTASVLVRNPRHS
jgi:hypothetical protein